MDSKKTEYGLAATGKLIDFEGIYPLLPEKGHILLQLAKAADGKMIVTYSARHKLEGGNTEEAKKKISPLTLIGTPQELNEHFASGLSEVVAAEKSVVDAITSKVQDLGATAAQTTEKKKADALKAKTKTQKKPNKGKTTEEAKDKKEKKSEEKKAAAEDKGPDLFSLSVVPPAPGKEEPGEGTAETGQEQKPGAVAA